MTVYDHVMNDVRLGQLAAGLMLDATAEGDIAQLNRALTVKRGLQSARSQLVSQHAEIVKHRERYAEMQARIAHLEQELHYLITGQEDS